MTFKTIEEIKELNEEIGHYFFTPKTMRFFKSKVGRKVYKDKYFITSEQFDNDSPRLFTIREAKADGSINTINGFQQFKTKQQAVSYINNNL